MDSFSVERMWLGRDSLGELSLIINLYLINLRILRKPLIAGGRFSGKSWIEPNLFTESSVRSDLPSRRTHQSWIFRRNFTRNPRASSKTKQNDSIHFNSWDTLTSHCNDEKRKKKSSKNVGNVAADRPVSNGNVCNWLPLRLAATLAGVTQPEQMFYYNRV